MYAIQFYWKWYWLEGFVDYLYMQVFYTHIYIRDAYASTRKQFRTLLKDYKIGYETNQCEIICDIKDCCCRMIWRLPYKIYIFYAYSHSHRTWFILKASHCPFLYMIHGTLWSDWTTHTHTHINQHSISWVACLVIKHNAESSFWPVKNKLR